VAFKECVHLFQRTLQVRVERQDLLNARHWYACMRAPGD
jgi:hypothetical protein